MRAKMTHCTTYLVSAALMMSAACGNGDAAEDCDLRRGTAFLATYQELSGDCGPLPSELTVFGSGVKHPGCVQGEVAVGEDCSVSNSAVCDLSSSGDAGDEQRINVVLHPDSGNGLVGTMEVRLIAGDSSCHSFYRATLVRQ
ncbi:MAG: hypothetical protein RL701_272 [Pseudomonadota bacterium]|jgi:hypothetical protein